MQFAILHPARRQAPILLAPLTWGPTKAAVNIGIGPRKSYGRRWTVHALSAVIAIAIAADAITDKCR
jgi:hypothetical protein